MIDHDSPRADRPPHSRSPSINEEDTVRNDDTSRSTSTTSPYRIKRKPVAHSLNRPGGHGHGSHEYAPVRDDPCKSKKLAKPTDKHSWGMEIFAMTLCLSSVVASTVLMFYADGRPLSDYNFIVSFNTLISILASTTRATLAFAVGACLGQWKWNWFHRRSGTALIFESFEDASRGPLGSLWLLYRLRARHWAAIGAFATVLMLGFEPFMQAIIYHEGKLITTKSRSAPVIGASNSLNIGSYEKVNPSPLQTLLGNANLSIGFGRFRKEPNAGFASAIYRGFYENDPRDSVLFTCSTGNCTWPVFASLSVCSSCNDISGQVKVSRQEGSDLGTIHILESHQEGHYITYALPYANLTNIAIVNSLSRVGRRKISVSAASLDPEAAYMSARTLFNQGNTLTFTELRNMITAVGLIRAEPAYANKSKPWNQTLVTATECALYFCTNAYKSGVYNGSFQEEIVASWSDRVAGSYSPVDWSLGTESLQAYENYINHSLYFDDVYNYLSDLQLNIPRVEAEKYRLPDDDPLLFNISQNTIRSTISFLEGFFEDAMVWPSGSIISETLYKSKNLSETFSNAASTMSKWIRDNSNMTHEGTQQDLVLHIRVRWPYVTLPALVVLMGCSFVFLSIWETWRLKLSPWKTDVFATLTHGLDSGAREQLRGAALEGRMRERAKQMVFNFEDAGEGLELKVQDESRSE